MRKKYYLIRIEGGVEAFTKGPFNSRAARDVAAKRVHELQEENDCVLWADTDEKGQLKVGSYASAFFAQGSLESV